ncbi:MAG: Gx transporter family protein [Lawsonibacter sp.]
MTRPPVNGTRRITLLALLTAIALTIFLVEAQLPVLIPIQGVKLGLANIITVYAVFVLGPWDALLVLLARVFLGAVFSGQMMTLLYSMGGGVLAWLVMIGLARLLTWRQLWLCSPVAAVFHNIGQLLVAAGVMKTWVVMAYLPYLLLSGIITGVFTGLCAQALIGRLNNIRP